ncbi:MAG: hypothetical protein KatS3mg113_0249 [Planctomycetaceae bacterium]|nr:MAG: hypothetical protein KatS3mg113_0249 [Planctomycetaceae bacterium]
MTRFFVRLILSCGLLMLAVGCTSSQQEYRPVSQLKPEPADEHHHGTHELGPHGGYLIELGQEEFHAELILDGSKNTLRVYLLGPDKHVVVNTSAQEVLIHLEEGDSLRLTPAETATDGQASVFELNDEKMVQAILHDGFLHGSLTVKIGEHAYQGTLDIHFPEEEEMHQPAAGEPSSSNS